MPSVPPAAIVPVAKPGSTRARRNSGIAARPKVAVVATDEPASAAIAQAEADLAAEALEAVETAPPLPPVADEPAPQLTLF